MKKRKITTMVASILLLSWLLISCGGDKTPTEEDVFGQDPTLPATTPAQHSAATTTQPNTVIADTGDGTVTATVDKNQMTDSGFTVGEEISINWMVDVLEMKKVGKGKGRRNIVSYKDVAKNLINKTLFKESDRVGLEHIAYWHRFRYSGENQANAREQLAEYYRWRVLNDANEKKWKLLEEACQRAKPAFDVEPLE